MTKPILHFAHANGVPSACYQKMLAVLAQDYQVVCIPIIGTSPKYPVANHWFNLAQQVADSIESQAQGQPAGFKRLDKSAWCNTAYYRTQNRKQ